MATDILEDLFYGRLSPWEEIPKGDPTIAQLIHQQAELRAQLEEITQESQKGLLAQYMNARADLESHLYCHYFKMGSLMGAKFAEQIHP